jgi:hypothetical protein
MSPSNSNNILARRTSRAHRPQPRFGRLTLECLESRTLLSAALPPLAAPPASPSTAQSAEEVASGGQAVDDRTSQGSAADDDASEDSGSQPGSPPAGTQGSEGKQAAAPLPGPSGSGGASSSGGSSGRTASTPGAEGLASNLPSGTGSTVIPTAAPTRTGSGAGTALLGSANVADPFSAGAQPTAESGASERESGSGATEAGNPVPAQTAGEETAGLVAGEELTAATPPDRSGEQPTAAGTITPDLSRRSPQSPSGATEQPPVDEETGHAGEQPALAPADPASDTPLPVFTGGAQSGAGRPQVVDLQPLNPSGMEIMPTLVAGSEPERSPPGASGKVEEADVRPGLSPAAPALSPATAEEAVAYRWQGQPSPDPDTLAEPPADPQGGVLPRSRGYRTEPGQRPCHPTTRAPRTPSSRGTSGRAPGTTWRNRRSPRRRSGWWSREACSWSGGALGRPTRPVADRLEAASPTPAARKETHGKGWLGVRSLRTLAASGM